MTQLEIKTAKKRLELENELLEIMRQETEIQRLKAGLENELDSLLSNPERYFYFESKINSFS